MDQELSSETIIRFDDPDPNLHDVVLVVEDQKFYCSKMYLAKHSPKFYDMFFTSDNTKDKKELIIDCIYDAKAFKVFLELLHGTNSLTDENIHQALWFAEHFNTNVVIDQCVSFLKTESKKSLKDKFDITMTFKLDDLKKELIANVKSPVELHKIVPDDIMELDHATMGLIFDRNLQLQGFWGRYIPTEREDGNGYASSGEEFW